jgi:hypothetical protein
MKLRPLVPPQATAGASRGGSLDSSSSAKAPSQPSSSFRSAGDFKKFLGLRAEAQAQQDAKAQQANTVSVPSAPAASTNVAVAAGDSMTLPKEAEIGTASAESKKPASRVTIPKTAASESQTAPAQVQQAAPAPISASVPSSQAQTSFSCAPHIYGGYATILSGPITSVTGNSCHKFDFDGGVMQFVARFDGVELSVDDLAMVAEDVPFIQDKAYLWVFDKEGGYAAKAEVTKPQMQHQKPGRRW